MKNNSEMDNSEMEKIRETFVTALQWLSEFTKVLTLEQVYLTAIILYFLWPRLPIGKQLKKRTDDSASGPKAKAN